VNRRLVVVLLSILVVLAALVTVVDLMRWRARREAAKTVAGGAAPRPVVREAPRAAAASAPAPEPETRTTRRAPAPRAETPPAPAPAEVAPETGVLSIDSDVPGAQVFIDREFIGTTPVTAQNVKPGSHRLNVSVQGYEGIADTIDVAPGPRDILIKFREVRLDVRMDVVHKHRIGSCKGQLVATPQGVRYQTTDRDDVFSAGLLDLETFRIEYLDNRLTIKPRKGKSFDFTDPEGNVDRLFVFHRDVEKARDRLKKGDAPATN
jgi:hypothetical protein